MVVAALVTIVSEILKAFAYDVSAVSYTHLDVYKRQVPAWESRYELPSLNSQFLISLRINVSSSYERKQARTGFLPERSTPLPG